MDYLPYIAPRASRRAASDQKLVSDKRGFRYFGFSLVDLLGLISHTTRRIHWFIYNRFIQKETFPFCYLLGGVVVRGCISQLLPGETSLCASGKQCKTCEGDNCNGKIEFQSCYACNSLTNPRCFLSQTSTNTQAVCADYLDDCVTYTVNGITTRGCKKDVEIPATCPSCSYCSTKNCNAYVATVPSELSCHVCDPTDPNCKADKSSDPSIRCDYSLVVGREDQCFLYQNEDKITRGCLQNAPFDIQWACISGTGECSLCGTSGCNSEEVELNGYCYFCDGVTDSNCAALTGVPSVYCPKGENKGCFRSQIGKYLNRMVNLGTRIKRSVFS